MSISVIIPCYNQAEFLPDAIESALGQTVPCEIIVVNDGSTDTSLEVAQRYSGIKIVNQVNKGLPAARNAGIMNAMGEYILPLDADDILLENCVERLEAAIAAGGADVIAPSFKSFGTMNGEVILSKIPTMEELKQGNRLAYFSAIKKSVLLEVGGYSPRMIFGYEDYSLWFDIFKRGHSLCMLEEVLVLYRTKEHSMIHDAVAHHNELMTQIIKDHPEVWQS